MTAKEYCMNHPAFAYYSGFSGMEIHGIENGFLYFVTGAWSSRRSRRYHKMQIRYDHDGNDYILFHGYKVLFSDFISMRG